MQYVVKRSQADKDNLLAERGVQRGVFDSLIADFMASVNAASAALSHHKRPFKASQRYGETARANYVRRETKKLHTRMSRFGKPVEAWLERTEWCKDDGGECFGDEGAPTALRNATRWAATSEVEQGEAEVWRQVRERKRRELREQERERKRQRERERAMVKERERIEKMQRRAKRE